MNKVKSSGLLAVSVLLLQATLKIHAQDPASSYKVSQVADKVWTIVENNTVNIYLVEGMDSALIIDTGYGTGDLKAFVKTLTQLPLIVVNTHGHGDHVRSNWQFPEIYLHPGDFKLIDTNIDIEKRKKAVLSGMADRQFSEVELEAMVNTAPSLLKPVKEGYIFDLGGRRLEVIEVPGHTHGSICLLDLDNQILFAGDHINSTVWLFLKDCYPLEVYLKSLEKIEGRMNEYTIIMPGHNTPLEKTFIREQVVCVKTILDGTCAAVPYDFSAFTAGALLCNYKTCGVAYDPDNLYISE